MSKLNGAKFINPYTGEECEIHCDGQRNENEPKENKDDEEQVEEELSHNGTSKKKKSLGQR